MASVASLREHLIEELNDLLNAEQQLVNALPQMQEKASDRQLKAAFRAHLAQTRTHAKRVTQALALLNEEASGKTCEAMEGLLAEGEELMSGAEAGALLDAMLITAAQKVEHYEIATYGCVRTYAQVIGERAVARLLEETLKEEKAADRKLTTVAEGGVNGRASKEWHEQTTMMAAGAGMLQKSAKWVGSTVGGAMKRVMPAQAADRGARRRPGASRSRAQSTRRARSRKR